METVGLALFSQKDLHAEWTLISECEQFVLNDNNFLPGKTACVEEVEKYDNVEAVGIALFSQRDLHAELISECEQFASLNVN